MIAWQDPPPYIQFMEEAETISRVGVSAAACGAFGFVFHEEQLRLLVQDFERRAIIAGADGPMLNASTTQAIETEGRRWRTMADLGDPNGPDRERREQQAVDFAAERCAEVLVDYPNLLSSAPE